MVFSAFAGEAAKCMVNYYHDGDVCKGILLFKLLEIEKITTCMFK